MNELLFFLQVALIISFSCGAKKLGKEALIASVVVQALIANLFVIKQITLFHLQVTASDAFAIGSLLSLNFLQEYESKEDAKKAVRICFFFLCFFTLAAKLHLSYEPNSFDTTHDAFLKILTLSPRLLIASMGSFFVAQQVDLKLMAFLKELLPKSSFTLRATTTLLFSQLVDTALFSVFGLYGVVVSLFEIIVISFLIKLIFISCWNLYMQFAKI